MADIEQMKKIVPLITCEIPFSQNVSELMFGAIVTNLILSNNQSRATLWVRETCLIVGLRPLIIILITASLSSKTDNIALESESVVFGGNVINVCWNDVGVLGWDGVMHIWLDNRRRVSPWLSLGSINSVRYGMKYFNHQIPESESGNTVHA